MSVLRVVPIYVSPYEKMLASMHERIARQFDLTIDVAPLGFDPETAFDTGRSQYNSRLLLARLQEDRDAFRVLGVAGVDLFIPVLTYVFGEAQLNGPAALVSLHRLRPETYGLPANEPLLSERLYKEIVHELGHTFGLLHCAEQTCVMRSSTYVEEIDLKGERFCGPCAAAVRHAMKSPDRTDRAS
jgi:archaemetzincin